jgi:hypothetical protein
VRLVPAGELGPNLSILAGNKNSHAVQISVEDLCGS